MKGECGGSAAAMQARRAESRFRWGSRGKRHSSGSTRQRLQSRQVGQGMRLLERRAVINPDRARPTPSAVAM